MRNASHTHCQVQIEKLSVASRVFGAEGPLAIGLPSMDIVVVPVVLRIRSAEWFRYRSRCQLYLPSSWHSQIQLENDWQRHQQRLHRMG